jgi:hypothetical protein
VRLTVSLEEFRELNRYCLYPVARTRFRALSVQGINEQRRLLFADSTIILTFHDFPQRVYVYARCFRVYMLYCIVL